jgi:hypothetical protein
LHGGPLLHRRLRRIHRAWWPERSRRGRPGDPHLSADGGTIR